MTHRPLIIVRSLKRTGHMLLLAAFVAFLAFPFYWIAITTFKSTRDLIDTTHNPFLFGAPPTLDNLRVLFFQTDFGRWIANTAEVGVLVTLITLLLAVPAGYALARLSGRWGHRLGIAIFLTYLIPPTILFIPFSRMSPASACRIRCGRWFWCTRASPFRSARGS